jgi:hypothetical protein
MRDDTISGGAASPINAGIIRVGLRTLRIPRNSSIPAALRLRKICECAANLLIRVPSASVASDPFAPVAHNFRSRRGAGILGFRGLRNFR